MTPPRIGLLSPAFLDELRARITLSGVVQRTVPLKRAGNEWKACCPFHAEKTPSFWVNDQKGFYHCFGCGAHGDAIRFLTESQGLPFMEAVKELADQAGLELPKPDPAAAKRQERALGLSDVVEQAAVQFRAWFEGAEGTAARAYAARRGLSAETLAAFRIGYAPDGRERMAKALPGAEPAMLVEAGLLIEVEGKPPYDRFRDRLMVPIRDPRGRVIAFGGRVIGQGEPPSSGSGQAKYLNSPETPLFDKGRTLFNLDRAAPAARKAKRLIVVEGYLDAIALDQAGISEVVAPLGTALTETQLELAWRHAEVPILCFDGDGAGRKAALRAAERALPLLQPGRSLAFVTLPHGQDPDDLVREGGREALEAQLKQAIPLVRLLWEAERTAAPLTTPEERAALGRRLRDHARTIRDEEVRTQYLAEYNQWLSELHEQLKGGSRPVPKGEIPPEVHQINRIGLDQAVMAPALIRGLIRFPDLIAPHAEMLAGMHLELRNLRQLREEMFSAALGVEALETDALVTILRHAGLGTALERLDRKAGLAFSFLRGDSDAPRARGDLATLIGALAEAADVDAALEGATERLGKDGGEGAFDEQRRLGEARERIKQSLAALTAVEET